MVQIGMGTQQSANKPIIQYSVMFTYTHGPTIKFCYNIHVVQSWRQ